MLQGMTYVGEWRHPADNQVGRQPYNEKRSSINETISQKRIFWVISSNKPKTICWPKPNKGRLCCWLPTKTLSQNHAKPPTKDFSVETMCQLNSINRIKRLSHHITCKKKKSGTPVFYFANYFCATRENGFPFGAKAYSFRKDMYTQVLIKPKKRSHHLVI